jgi:subtilisin family serine protease
MSISSPSNRRFPKSLAFMGLLGLLLIAAVAVVPNSNAGLTAFQNGGGSGAKRSRPEFVPGEALVRFKSEQAFEGSTNMPVPNKVVQQKISGIQGTAAQEQILVQVDRFGGSDLVDGLRIARAPDTGKLIAALRARDDVAYAEPNYIVHAINTPNDPCFVTNSLPSCQSTSLYGLNKIAAPQAWDLTQGNNSVVVGIIDEGIDISHPDLAANIWTNPAPGSISGISGDLHGYDFINNSGTIPPEGHATHVAGTIGAVGNNGVGVVGVNWQVQLMSLRFIDQTTNNGTTADAIRAYNYAKQMRDLYVSSSGMSGANIRALNASYGGGGFSKAEQDALTALGNSGILFAAAAGNDGRNTDAAPNYPSGYNLTNMISVEATDQNDARAGFSNFGAKSVLMGAPGVGILSTTPGNTYSVLSGTSMATPHVTGAAALVCAANPNVSINQLHALLAFNGDVIPALAGTTLTGRRLNVFKSIQALNEGDITPPGTVGNFRVTSQTGRAVSLAWTASGDDGALGQASLYDISFTDQFTGAVVPLTTIAPAASGSPQTVTVNIPYRHTSGFMKLREFDNVGNEGTATVFPVAVDRLVADPYATSLSSPAALSTGGTPLAFNCDDCFKTNTLPFSFPFFGTNYSSITISSNGNIYFVPPAPPTRGNGDADDVPSSIGDLASFKKIAGMWDDLDLRTCFRSDADVYVIQPDSSRIIFRWQGIPFTSSTCPSSPLTDPNSFINFEIELNSDGTIKTRYGSGNVNLRPVVGISGGEPDVYVADALTSELSPISLTNAQGAVFTPRALVPLPAVQFSSASYSVTKGDPNNPRVNIAVTRAGDTTSSASVGFATIDDAGLQNCNVFNGIASPRCDYENTQGTMTFAAGETSKSFSVAIVADSYAKGNLTFRVALSGPSGATLGSPSIATVTILDNPSVDGPNNPIDNTNFFVRQQYLDFLGREPDPPGFAGWTSTINNCSGDTTQCDRIHVSQLFFQSAEFQDRGYFVYRFYPVAFGRKPDYGEFVPDLASVSGFLDANQLEAAKVAFIAAFMARPAFANTYNPLTNQQYVDMLLNTAVVTLSSRQAMIDGLNNSTMTRGQVLRQIVESPEVSTKYNHQAYAVMEYFGYLRRQPDAFYLQWIAVLDSTNDPRGMVTGFVNSQEYRNRFGP